MRIRPAKFFVFLTVFLLSCSSGAAGEVKKPSLKKTKVEILQLKPRILKSYSTYIGHLDPNSRVTISSESAGIIDKVNVDAGSVVKSGDMLVQIDTKRQLLNKRLNQSNYELALKEYEWEKKLLTKNISTLAKVSNLRNKAEVHRLRLELSNLELLRSKVKAPISGIINSKNIEAGEYVKVGAKLMEIFDISKVLAIIHIPEKEIRFLKPGKKVLVSADAFPDQSFIGIIKNKALEADKKSRSFEIEVLIDNPHRILLPGLFVRVRMLKVHLKNQIIIPRHTIQESENGSFVYIVNKGKIVKKEILIGISVEDEVQITTGLKVNEYLVDSGHQLISPNEIVEIINIRIQG